MHARVLLSLICSSLLCTSPALNADQKAPQKIIDFGKTARVHNDQLDRQQVFYNKFMQQRMKLPCLAVVIKPVIDLVRMPIGAESYAHLPLSWNRVQDKLAICPRDHQLLFNEIVTIVQEQGEEVMVEVANTYCDNANGIPTRTTYWTLKENLMPFDWLRKLEIDPAIFPEPIEFEGTTIDQSSHNVITDAVTLKFPYRDPINKTVYSAGTRFVVAPARRPEHITVHLFDSHYFSEQLMDIPAALCAIHEPQTTQEKIAAFVDLIRCWAHLPEGVIPFVWGGTSFAHACPQHNATTTQKTIDGTSLEYWNCKHCADNPCSGFDISGLVVRAAQICGIPYFYKNTTTAAHHLTPRAKNEIIQAGDLIWLPGGLLIVSDIENNMIIASCGYGPGYGSVIEIPISKLLKDINSYTDLENAYRTGQPLTTLNADGTTSRTVDTFAIFTLENL